MSDVHRIRLRAPWELTILPDGRQHCQRRFGLPTGLTPHHSVCLVIEQVGVVQVVLNARELEEMKSPMRFEIGGKLTERNQLELRLDGEFNPEGVWLEIVDRS